MTGPGKFRSQRKGDMRPPGGAPKKPPPLGLFRVSKHAKRQTAAKAQVTLPNNKTGKYILDGHNPVEEPDLFKWAEWYETADRQVRDTFQGDVRVSTVFLGLDYNFHMSGPPILFETRAFVGHVGVEQKRYSTWAEAEEGHANMVAKVFKPTPILALPEKP